MEIIRVISTQAIMIMINDYGFCDKFVCTIVMVVVNVLYDYKCSHICNHIFHNLAQCLQGNMPYINFHLIPMCGLSKFFPPQSRRCFFMVVKTFHNSGKNFIPCLGSKTNVCIFYLITMEFMSVIDNNIHIKKILLAIVESIAKKMK